MSLGTSINWVQVIKSNINCTGGCIKLAEEYYSLFDVDSLCIISCSYNVALLSGCTCDSVVQHACIATVTGYKNNKTQDGCAGAWTGCK